MGCHGQDEAPQLAAARGRGTGRGHRREGRRDWRRRGRTCAGLLVCVQPRRPWPAGAESGVHGSALCCLELFYEPKFIYFS